MKRYFISILIFPSICFAQCKIDGALPDKNCTPGVVREATTANDICTSGFTKTIRNVPESEKKKVYLEYNMTPNKSPCPCEVDHFISLVIGGDNTIKNLWPQPYSGQFGAREKDKLENYYHRQICDKKITQEQAIKEIREDWTKYYLLYGLDIKKGAVSNDNYNEVD